MLSNQTPNVEIRIWLARGSAIEREAGVAAQPLECQLIARRKPPRLPFLTTVAVIWSDRLIDRSTSEALRILAENAHPFSAGLVSGRRTSGNGFRFLYTGRRFVASARGYDLLRITPSAKAQYAKVQYASAANTKKTKPSVGTSISQFQASVIVHI